MGSLSKIDSAYIAGFLDGDGSLMLQIKRRKDGQLKRRFMSTICFYQDSRHERDLYWIRKQVGIGYISRRKDGMSELRINGFKQVRDIIKKLLPYIRFKRKQAEALYESSNILSSGNNRYLKKNDLIKLVRYILLIQENNYATRHKKTKQELLKILDLTP